MAEQIILNTDLYDNLLTERKGDYTAKPRITGTLYNTDIAARIVAARTEYQHGTILNILDMADSHKVQAIAEGKSVVDGVGQYLVNVQGAFEGEKAVGATARVRTRSEDNVVRHVRTTAAKHRGQRLPSLPDRGYRTCRKKQPIYKPYYTHRT